MDIAQSTVVQRCRNRFEHREAEIFERWNSIGQRQSTAQMIDFQPQKMLGIAGEPVESGRTLAASFELEQPHDVLRGFQCTIGRLISPGETIGIALRQNRRATFLPGFSQISLDFRFPAPDHVFQLLVEQVGVGNPAVCTHIERVTQRRYSAFFQGIGPA